MRILVHGDKDKEFLVEESNIRTHYYANVAHDGNNIDFLRPWFCELTALYYVLANYTDSIIGIEQYRRFILDDDGKHPITESEALAKLVDADVICGYNRYPDPWAGNYIYQWPIKTGKQHYFEVYLDVLKDMHGDKVYNHFKTFLYGQWHCHGNLVIGKREVIKEYFDFLMDSFITLNTKLNIKDYPRMVEYLSEFLFGAWLTYNNKKICWQPWFNCGKIMELNHSVEENNG